jgi:ABC-type phosphate transport system substrate-binding protein
MITAKLRSLNSVSYFRYPKTPLCFPKNNNSLPLKSMRLTNLFFTGAIALTYPLGAFADTFPKPASVPPGTSIAIDGSSSLAVANQSLKESFERQFPDTTVNIEYEGSDRALQELEKGAIDIAAIGRPLTEEEKAKGLKTIALPRRKIAIVVSAANPFQGTLTDRQFADITQGKITDWSALGREAGPIQVIDRPLSDTRTSLATYPIFQSGFAPETNSIKVEEDSTAAITEKLGKDGISYTIADQAVKNPDLRVLSMFHTPVTDERYPFSQPRYLVYKDATRPGVRYFLGFVNSATGQTAIASVPTNLTPALLAGKNTPTPTVPESPTTTANAGTVAPTETRSAPWWWLLFPLALLGGLGLWWKNRRSGAIATEFPPPMPPIPPVTPVETSTDVPVPAVIPQEEADPVADFLDSLIDPDLDTEVVGIDRQTVADMPFPGIDRQTVADMPFPGIDRQTVADMPFPEVPTDDTTVANSPYRVIDPEDIILDLPFLEDEEIAELSSSLLSGFVPPLLATADDSSVTPNLEFIEAEARAHCYELDDLRLLDLESRSNCLSLDPGTYRIRIVEGVFRYGSEARFPEGEPLVLLWIFGGRLINRQTNVEVGQTWVSLNGYEDELILRVLENTRLCGLFFDTYAEDNQGQIELAIDKL